MKIIKTGEFFKKNNTELISYTNTLNNEVRKLIEELDEDDPEDQKVLNELFKELVKLREILNENRISKYN